MAIYAYRGDITAQSVPPRVFIGKRSGFVVVEIRLGKGRDILPAAAGWMYPVVGVLVTLPAVRWPKVVISIHEARKLMWTADEAAYADEFNRITIGENR